MAVTKQEVLSALSRVIDPELNLDLVRAGMVKDLVVDGNAVSVTIELTTPACPLKGQIQQDAERALAAIPGIESKAIRWTAQVRPAPEPKAPSILPGVKNVVLVGAGKGGVGKSTVAVNLAAALARCGASVGLLDADIHGPSIPLMTGIRRRPTTRDGKVLDPLEAHGMRVMSIGFIVDPDQAMLWRGPMIHGALLQLLKDVRWGNLDYLILDLPPGTGDAALTLTQQLRAAGAVLVTTPQDVALADVVRAKQMFDKVYVPILGVIENMSQFICPHCHGATEIFDRGGGRKAAEAMGVPFLGELPLLPSIRQSSDRGVPAATGNPKSPEASAFFEIARAVAGRISQQNLALHGSGPQEFLVTP